MRLFISFNSDDKTTHELLELQDCLRESGARGNYTKSENLHMTVAFIGEYGNPDDVLDVMENVSFRPIDIRFDALQLFREMYLLRVSQNPGLESYVRRLRRALAENDIPYDKKKFSPHITLIRRVSFRNGEIEKPESIHVPYGTRVEHVSLMRSERGKNGMIYTELGSV